jgi:16S rRNA G966 N2-methylase RsmD
MQEILPHMNRNEIRKKFGGDYIANEQTFNLGSDHRFTYHFAERFEGMQVLETCTGAGFTTIPLARRVKYVYTVEIDLNHQKQAIANVEIAGLQSHVSFIHGDILDETILTNIPLVDGAFLDPDWVVAGPDHVYRFKNSNTQPPADVLLNKISELTENIALVLPPYIDTDEFRELPRHERESLYLGESHELFCLYFGELIRTPGETEYCAPD